MFLSKCHSNGIGISNVHSSIVTWPDPLSCQVLSLAVEALVLKHLPWKRIRPHKINNCCCPGGFIYVTGYEKIWLLCTIINI